MTAYQELWVEAIDGAGTHPGRPDLYQVVLQVATARGASSTNLTLTFETDVALSLLAFLQAKPPNQPSP